MSREIPAGLFSCVNAPAPGGRYSLHVCNLLFSLSAKVLLCQCQRWLIKRRRAQNRASQRAYRERKDQRMKDLEQMLKDTKQRNDILSQAPASECKIHCHKASHLEYCQVELILTAITASRRCHSLQRLLLLISKQQGEGTAQHHFSQEIEALLDVWAVEREQSSKPLSCGLCKPRDVEIISYGTVSRYPHSYYI